MKILVVYFSRTGNTRKVATRIAESLQADIEEIKETQSRAGVAGYFGAGLASLFRKTPRIEPHARKAADFDLTIIGTPVWAFTMAAPVRTYLEQNAGAFSKVAFFCTMGGSGASRTFQHMQEILGTVPEATLSLNERQLKGNDLQDLIREFTEKMRA
ncbi:MAG: NAD(P)H-dependent oxidoreductase [Candidatus Pacebacteria bacterium]|nr:NAD(P)H-dependent oxidoreductase [Candidatus Paceibacterota bacterium]